MTEKKKTHHAVHIFAVTRVKVLVDPKDVLDDKPETLIRAAEESIDLYSVLSRGRCESGLVESVEYAEDISHYLIDKAGDEEYRDSEFYLLDPNGYSQWVVYPDPGGCRRVVIVVEGGVVTSVLSSHKDIKHAILDHDEAKALRETAPPPFKASEFENTSYAPNIDKIREEFDKEHSK